MASILIAVADYYPDITNELVLGARSHLESAGYKVELVNVPGAFELPLTILYALESDHDYEGFVVLGCVIRGETSHYDIVCNETARGIQQLMLETAMPIGFGVLTVESLEQAKARANVNGKNKGKEAAAACLHMLKLKQHFAPTESNLE